MKFILVLLMLAASQAHGEVYTWKDSRGVDHYTNRKDDIPVRYRSDAKALDYDREPKAAGLPAPGNGTAASDRPEQPPQEEDQRGRTKVKRHRPERDRE